MIIPNYIPNWAPSPYAVETFLDTLSRWAPTPSSVWAFLNTLASFAPSLPMVWLLPMSALVIAIVHALITHRSDMMVGSAVLLCFYTVGTILLPTVQAISPTQMELIVTLHAWFSCVASYIYFACVAGSLIGHFATVAWDNRIARLERQKTMLNKTMLKTAIKKRPSPKPLGFSAPSKALDATTNRAKNVHAAHSEPTF